jgi:hypothetical protein
LTYHATNLPSPFLSWDGEEKKEENKKKKRKTSQTKPGP